MFRYPIALFPISVLLLWLSARIGVALRKTRPLIDDEREDFGIVQAASLTLLSLIIGFSFSMAINRYDQRRTLEESEANAISTEYVRSELLPKTDCIRLQKLLKQYLDLRISFYSTRNQGELQEINADTGKLEGQMWSAVQLPALAQPTPVAALVVAGINDVLNSQGYTQAAWWNRIPTAAWVLMALIAIACNLLTGYGGRSSSAKHGLVLILPLIVSIAFLLIADIDTPRRGMIHVPPQNLISLSLTLSKR